MRHFIRTLTLRQQKRLTLALACVLAVILLVLVLLWSRYSEAANRLETTGFAMGSFVQQTVYGPGGQEASDAALQAVTDLENKISWRVEDSDIARLNDEAGSEWIDIDPETAELLLLCLDVAEQSGGVYDPTVLPISKLWNFDDGDAFSPPSQETIDRFLPYVNYEDLRVKEDESSASLKYHYMGVDLGSIGKGAGCDTAVASYASSGISGAIAAVGGSVGVYGEKPDGTPWSITVRNPYSSDDGEEILGVMEMEEGFVSTSGSYEKQCEVDGVVYHHLINADTGWPEDNELVSVTVYTKDSGALSDLLATAAFLLGPDEGQALLESYGAEGIFVFRDKTVLVTDGFPPLTLSLDSFQLAE